MSSKNKICGVYTITNLLNGKMYVGQSKTIGTRKTEHFKHLRAGIHNSSHLQKAYNLYGEENFLHEILVECEEQFLCSEEHYWATMLDVHNPDRGYNIRPTHPYGKQGHSKETRLKLKNSVEDVLNPNYHQAFKYTHYRKPVLQFDLEGNFIKEWISSRHITDELQINYSRLRRHVRGTYNHYKEHIFMYKENYTGNVYDHKYFNVNERIFQFNQEGKLVKVHSELYPLAKYIHIHPNTIRQALKKDKLELIRDSYWSYKYLTPQEINERKVVNSQNESLVLQ